MKPPAFIAEFKQSLKNPSAEELIDLAFFRPAAFLFVKVLAIFPISPNQISFVSMFFGIIAGLFFALGNSRGFIIGATLYGLSTIFDCCDGMIARLKKNGTLTGRIVDGIVDYVTSLSVYIGLGVGLSKALAAKTIVLPCNPWILIGFSIISHIIHSIFSDKYRNGYLNREKAKPLSAKDEYDQFAVELCRLNQSKSHAFDRVLIGIYLRYLNLQKGNGRTVPANKSMVSPLPFTALKAILWNVIGPSTHISFLIVAACLFNPMIYFIFVLCFSNFWVLGLLTAQRLIRF